MNTSIFCCDIFSEHIDAGGSKGFAIIPFDFKGVYKFVLQSRTKDYYDKEPTRHYIAERTISYCPWCGCNLAKIIANNENEIKELAKKNEYLFTHLGNI